MPITREVATRLVSLDDIGLTARRMCDYVRRNLRHVDEGVELIHRPEYLLAEIAARRPVFGDCDDEATLIGALVMALGIPARFVAMRRSDRSSFEHVFCESWTGETWQMLDPRHQVVPPGAWIRMVEEF